jgi:superfamily I DNA and/or RNA helicase
MNPLESKVAIKIVNDYLDLGFDQKDIGIISPYADQVGFIKNKVDVDVKSVDGFQGKEKEIIIISTVRSNEWGNIGFLRDLRRLNVAITRAKKKLIIIGNIETLSHNPTYKRLIDYCRKQDVILEL